MTELLTRAPVTEQDYTNYPPIKSELAKLEDMLGNANVIVDDENNDGGSLDSNPNSVDTIPDSRETSPTGSFIMRAATRMSNFLEQRAINKSHTEALVDHREVDTNGYIDHMAKLADSTKNPEAAEYAKSQLNKEYARADREEMLENAHQKITDIGSTALVFAKDKGLIALGAGVMLGQDVKRDMTDLKAGASKILSKAAESLHDDYDTAKELGSDTYNTMRESLINKRKAAQNRKLERRNASAKKREARAEARQLARDERAAGRKLFYNRIGSKIERGKANLDVARGVGSAAVNYLLNTRQVVQNSYKELNDVRRT